MGKPKGKNKRSNTKTVPKTRKEIRKEKRIQKKENKNKFFSKKNEKFVKNQEMIVGRFIRPLKNSKSSVQIPKNINNDGNDILNTTADDIESDFELSDEEMNEKLNKISNKNTKQSPTTIKQKPKPQKIEIDRFHQNQEREKRKQKELEKKTHKRRIQQLREANEEEDRIIRKLEKKLKIDKHKNDKSVHKMFSSDGLDYALELCLPENIEKMYTAAKEASKLDENDNGDDFEEDIRMALNRRNGNNLSGVTTGEKETKKNVKDNAEKVEKKKQVKLKKIENKYFNDEFDINTGSGNDDDDSRSSVATDSEDNSDDDNDDDELNNIGNDIENDENDSEIDYDENEVESDDFESQEENEVKKHENKSKNTKSKEEFHEKDYEDSDESELDADTNDKTLEQNSEDQYQKSGDDNDVDGIWEDIYGRKRDKHGNIITETTPQLESGKYIPPHVRRLATTVTGDDGNENQDEYSVKNKERLDNLRRICKGYLNRLSEANMHKISTDIENLYTKNSRYDMNNTLCKLIDDALVLNVLSKERLILEHTMLIALLHANIGNEVGAQFLQFIINKFHQMIINVHQLEVEDKKLDNIICILSHLYTFKVFQHNLIFEIINKLIENLCEKTVECILLILRSVGFQLRKDDPLALKELISKIQKKALETTSSDIKDNPRLKFMLDCLNAIKNNNMNKIPNYDPTLAEHLKKILRSILINGKYVTTLNITLDDLLNADEKGKWWIVGSAWTGNIKDMGPANQLSNKLNSDNNKTEMFSEKLLELAKAQKMNTEDRKNIFCIIMSAEDYLDAFERLLHLSIKDNRVIGSIIVHCCLSEKQFNPYYAVLAQKFCEYDRKYQLAFQFCLWDRIREINSSTKTQLQNLSQFLIHLILNGGLPISVLKIIEFAELDKVSLKFTRQTVLGILLADEEECKRVFERIAPSMKLNTFKDCIRLFMHHFLLRESKKSKNISEEQMKLLKRRVSLVDGILEFVGTKVKF